MRYCTHCVIPDTRPNIKFDSVGLCNACDSHGKKPNINWVERAEAFKRVVANAKARGKAYDCLIPVSGGKDSTWQVVKCLEAGLHPLTFSWKPPSRTKIGTRNLENLIRLGVDHIDYQVNPEVEKKFIYLALAKFGSTGIPMHMAIFNMAPSIAVKFNIPLIIWGENSAFEYGGTEEENLGFKLDEAWLSKFGVTHGTTAHSWISEELSKEALTPYFSPSAKVVEEKKILSVFLGYYFEWDVGTSLASATANGFQRSSAGPKTGYYDYADIDDDFISVHHYFKWLKFGFTRLFDNLSLEIRNGRMSRGAAVKTIKEMGKQRPDDDIQKLCHFLGISEQQFREIEEKFRNREIWKSKNGTWIIKDFLINDWEW